jgi:hypothetical protein
MPVEVINMENVQAGLVFLGFIVFGVLIAEYVKLFLQANLPSSMAP